MAVLASVEQTIIAKKKMKIELGHDKLEACLQSKLAQTCSSADEKPDQIHYHAYMDTLAQACVIYCLCGYLVCSVGKHNSFGHL